MAWCGGDTEGSPTVLCVTSLSTGRAVSVASGFGTGGVRTQGRVTPRSQPGTEPGPALHPHSGCRELVSCPCLRCPGKYPVGVVHRQNSDRRGQEKVPGEGALAAPNSESQGSKDRGGRLGGGVTLGNRPGDLSWDSASGLFCVVWISYDDLELF